MLLFFICQKLLLINWSLKGYWLLKKSTRKSICSNLCPLFPKMTTYFSNQYQFIFFCINISYIVSILFTDSENERNSFQMRMMNTLYWSCRDKENLCSVLVWCLERYNPRLRVPRALTNNVEVASPPFNEGKSDCRIPCVSYGAHFPCNIGIANSAESALAAWPHQSGGSSSTARKRASGLLRDLDSAPQLGISLTGLFQYKAESHLSPSSHRKVLALN